MLNEPNNFHSEESPTMPPTGDLPPFADDSDVFDTYRRFIVIGGPRPETPSQWFASYLTDWGLSVVIGTTLAVSVGAGIFLYKSLTQRKPHVYHQNAEPKDRSVEGTSRRHNSRVSEKES